MGQIKNDSEKQESKVDEIQEKIDLVYKLDYYERLLDFLDDMVPCLDELISQFDKDEE